MRNSAPCTSRCQGQWHASTTPNALWTRGGVYRTWMSAAFHHKIVGLWTLAVQTEARPTHLADIVRCKPTHMGFCNASVLGKRGVWLHPSRSGCNLVFCHPWPPDIIKDLVLLINPDDKITKSNLGIAALVLHEATLLAEVPTACMTILCSGSDNMPTVL